MIDFHCHIDLYPEPAAVIAEITRRGLYVLAVTTTPKAYQANRIYTKNSKRIRVAVGLHPELVAERSQEVTDVCRLLRKTQYVGEIGIDGSAQHSQSLGLQKDVFKTILAHAAQAGGRVLSIHSRRAASMVMDELDRYPRSGIPILHWFSGSGKELDRAVERGCWFSVGPAILASKRGRELASKMPSDRVLPETDGPFGQHKMRSLMPWDTELTLPVLAVLWQMSEQAVRTQMKDNLRSLSLTGTKESKP